MIKWMYQLGDHHSTKISHIYLIKEKQKLNSEWSNQIDYSMSFIMKKIIM